MRQVCLIDPDERWQQSLTLILHHHLTDIRCLTNNGTDFTASLVDADLVICSRQSAHLSVDDVLAYLRLQTNPPPVIVVGEPDDDERHIVAALRAGAVDYVRLPHLDHLPEIINVALNRSPQHTTAYPSVHNVLATAPVIIWQVSLDGIITGVRGGGLQPYGDYSVDRINGQSLAQIIRSQEQTGRFLQRLQAGEDFVQQLHGLRTRWDVYCHPVKNVQGEVLYGTALAIDVTRDTMLADELVDSDDRFASLFRMLPDAAVIISVPGGQILAANSIFLTLLGTPDAVLTGQDILNVCSRADRQLWSDLLMQHTVNGIQRQVHPATGATVDVLVSATPLDLINIPSMLVTLVDMAQANAQKAQLQQSEQKLRTIINETSDIILIIDLETQRIETANPALYHLTGWHTPQIINKPFADLLADADHAHDIITELLAYGAVFKSLQLNCVEKRRLSVDMTATVIKWDDKQAILMNLRDVSEREVALRALHEAEERLRTVINKLPVMIATIDRRGMFTLSAGSGLDVLGLKTGQAIGQSAFEVYARYPALLADVQQALKGETFRSQHLINTRTLESHYTPIFDAHNQIIATICVAMDITARLEAERIKVEMEQERERMAFRQGFASMITHEFRTPMSVIMTSADLAQRMINDANDGGWMKQLNKIRAQIYYMTHLLDDVLLISSGQSGALEFYPEVMDFSALCTSITLDLGLHHTEKHTYINQVDPDLTRLYLDPSLMRHVLTNLVQNAVKYTPAGGEICFETCCEDDTLTIVVADTGIGIPEEDQKHLFEIFERGSNTGQIKGTGLGLALVKYCLDAHGGTITVDSAVGAGTTFTVQVPLREPPH